MNIYWHLDNLSYQQRIDKLKKTSSDELIGMILNKSYNDFLSAYSDYDKDEQPVNPSISNGKEFGKRIPYHGWYWRSVNFYTKDVRIGSGNGFKGFMAHNKWYFPEGEINEEQFNQVMTIIDQAMRFSEQGGDLSEIRKDTVKELEKLWPLFQELKVIMKYPDY